MTLPHCRILYTLGWTELLNFPLTVEEQAELDMLGVREVDAAFRHAGRASLRAAEGFYGVHERAGKWRGQVGHIM